MTTNLQLFQNSRPPLLRKRSCILLLLLILSISSFSQLSINTNANAQSLVNSLVEQGVTVSNAQYHCPVEASGIFSGTSNIGFEKGVLLTTGYAVNAKGPNDEPSASYNSSAPGDVQLDTFLGVQTFDGCSLEFDVTPSFDTLKIKYVFGSEEYPEFVNQTFNDAFGIFVSGPGITGNKNIACVPGSATPVSINSINAQLNSKYYVDNTNGQTIEYDGFTKPMIAFLPVTPLNSSHIKIVIADVQDGIYDSGLFLEAGSISCSPTGKNAERCGAGLVNLSATASSGTINWYSEKTGGTLVHTGTDYAVNLVATTTFYVESTQPSCSSSRTPVTGIINPEVSKPAITESGGVLSAPAGYTYQWYLNNSILSGETHQTCIVSKTGNYTVMITNDKNCSATSDAFSITVGISATPLNALTHVYPNPANELIYIQVPVTRNSMTVSIYSVIGKLIYQETYINTNEVHTIHTGSIETNGIYFIKLQSGDETIIRKIQINH